MYLGRRFKANGNADRVFNSGGAAYALNQASLGLLASHLDDEACEAHRKCSWEDVQVTNERAREGGNQLLTVRGYTNTALCDVEVSLKFTIEAIFFMVSDLVRF